MKLPRVSATPSLMQRLHRDRNHAQGFARLLKLPAGDGDHAVGLQMFEVFAEGFHRIETVFAQGKRARCGGSPRIDQGHLHDVELLAGVAHKRTAIGDVDMNLGPIVEVVDVVGITAAHDGVGDDGIDFDSSNAGTSVGQRPHHIHVRRPGPMMAKSP